MSIVQTLLESRIIHPVPYHQSNSTELDRLNILLRSAVKTALGLPPHTATQRLLQLGLDNTLEELIEAHTAGQHTRLGNIWAT